MNFFYISVCKKVSHLDDAFYFLQGLLKNVMRCLLDNES